MHSDSLDRWQSNHNYVPPSQRSAERRIWIVVGITLAAMVLELAVGYLAGSMALVADGWHMASHAAALGISAAAYVAARRLANDARFTFGTGKIGPLAGYTSALLLLLVAGAMALQSIARLLDPVEVQFDQALVVAVIGLGVNLACAWILTGDDAAGGHGRHGHDHPHGHPHGHPHLDHPREHEEAHDPAHRPVDHSYRAAALHVVADALTSVLAIAALLAGKYAGLAWLDPVMGLVGAAIITHWSVGLLRQTGAALLDADTDAALVADLRARIEADADNRVADFHLWRLGPESFGLIVSIVTHEPRPVEHYKALLAGMPLLAHVTVEVNRCCA